MGASAFRQVETGTQAAKGTFFRSKKEYGQVGVSELRRLRQLEGGNREFRQLILDLGPYRQMLQSMLSHKF